MTKAPMKSSHDERMAPSYGPRRKELPLIFREVDGEMGFADGTEQAEQRVRNLASGQKAFLLTPRRFGKRSPVSIVFQLLKEHVRTVIVPVSNCASYSQFLDRFADRVHRPAEPWDRVKARVGRLIVKPEAEVDTPRQASALRTPGGRESTGILARGEGAGGSAGKITAQRGRTRSQRR